MFYVLWFPNGFNLIYSHLIIACFSRFTISLVGQNAAYVEQRHHFMDAASAAEHNKSLETFGDIDVSNDRWNLLQASLLAFQPLGTSRSQRFGVFIFRTYQKNSFRPGLDQQPKRGLTIQLLWKNSVTSYKYIQVYNVNITRYELEWFHILIYTYSRPHLSPSPTGTAASLPSLPSLRSRRSALRAPSFREVASSRTGCGGPSSKEYCLVRATEALPRLVALEKRQRKKTPRRSIKGRQNELWTILVWLNIGCLKCTCKSPDRRCLGLVDWPRIMFS